MLTTTTVLVAFDLYKYNENISSENIKNTAKYLLKNAAPRNIPARRAYLNHSFFSNE